VAEISTIADSPTLWEARIQVFSYGDCNGNRRDTPFSIKVFPATPGFQCAKDADHDGVPDDRDVCPGSTRGSREHVDINGCEHDQVDFDMDGVCNPGMPRIGKKPFSTRADFCVGVDNCKLVKNPGQEQNYPADAGNDGDGAGDACNTGEWCAEQHCSYVTPLMCVLLYVRRVWDAAGCHEACLIGCDSIASQSPRDSIKACTSPFRGGRYHNNLRCNAGFRHIEYSDFGCEKA
jgi:hypothetical protein